MHTMTLTGRIFKKMAELDSVDVNVVFDNWKFLRGFDAKYYDHRTFMDFVTEHGLSDFIERHKSGSPRRPFKCLCGMTIQRLYFIVNIETDEVRLIGSTCFKHSHSQLFKAVKVIDKTKVQIQKLCVKLLKEIGATMICYGKYKGHRVDQVGFSVYRNYLQFLYLQNGKRLSGQAKKDFATFNVVDCANAQCN